MNGVSVIHWNPDRPQFLELPTDVYRTSVDKFQSFHFLIVDKLYTSSKVWERLTFKCILGDQVIAISVVTLVEPGRAQDF